ncbi:MAG: hypothetical protein M1819_001954 [Sarea resinae]|nr:MAG: hypothetical protein M1819_001954 [Sarea resinae]
MNNLLWAALIALLYPIYLLLQVGKRHPRMPPGPPTVPILGNAHQIPLTGLGKRFAEWSKQYGSVFSLKIGPTNVVVLCDRKSVAQLLDKKGSIYSDRPLARVTQFITRGDHLTLEAQGPSWRMKRSVVTNHFNPKQLDDKHWKVQEAEAVVFMNNLLRQPEKIFDFAKLYTASVATTLIYGQRAASLDSFWNKDVYILMDHWVVAEEPGANPPVDEFPLLWYWPGNWKTRAYKTRALMDSTWSKARSIVEERRAKGNKRDCLIDAKLDEYNAKGFPMSQHAFTNLFGELVEAGSDTTANSILTMIFSLAKYPWVQEKARVEIDKKECDGAQRMSPPFSNPILWCDTNASYSASAGLPHKVTQDDEYEGMFIPKGSTVFAGIWAMHQNETLYPNHDTFNPDRYLNHPKLANDYAVGSDYMNRDHYGYGTGRRMCPGIHLAERSMWRIAAKLLWAFDISEPLDPVTGEVIPLDPEAFSSAILLAPKPFQVRIVPRSDKHLAAIERELAGSLDFLSQWE